MKYTKYIMVLLCLTTSVLIAQELDEADRPSLPDIGFAFAGGYGTGELGGQDYDGFTGQFRLVALPFKTYPAFFVGLDIEQSWLQFNDAFDYTVGNVTFNVNNLNADRTSLAPIIGIMLPFDLFTDNPDIPKGAGMPFYFGYNIVDRFSFDEFDENLKGDGFKVGAQLPVPLKLPAGAQITLMVEYYKSEFDGSDELPSFVTGLDDLDSDGWNFMFQVGIPLTFNK